MFFLSETANADSVQTLSDNLEHMHPWLNVTLKYRNRAYLVIVAEHHVHTSLYHTPGGD